MLGCWGTNNRHHLAQRLRTAFVFAREARARIYEEPTDPTGGRLQGPMSRHRGFCLCSTWAFGPKTGTACTRTRKQAARCIGALPPRDGRQKRFVYGLNHPKLDRHKLGIRQRAPEVLDLPVQCQRIGVEPCGKASRVGADKNLLVAPLRSLDIDS